MAFTYQDMGHMFHDKSSAFSVIAGWITKMLIMLFFAYIAV